MTEILDRVIDQALMQGVKFDTIWLDVRSFESLHKELGQKDSKLIGYKGFTLKVNYTNAFSDNNFLIQLA